jgi:RNA polymerase sigma-70 factor, ECF subfamily
MYPTNTLTGPLFGDIMAVGGGNPALADTALADTALTDTALANHGPAYPVPANPGAAAAAGSFHPGAADWSDLWGAGQDVRGSVAEPRAGRREGGCVGTDGGAETGPYATVAATSGAGRHAAAGELFAAHYPKLAGWVRRLVDDDETAHEIASEAFVRLLSKWTSPDKLDSPQSYLYMIATNLVRDHWRKMERERRALSRAAAGTDPEPYADPSQDVDVRELLASLPAKLREPFLLHYYAGFGIKEIAVQLKKPEGTIKADLYHARARLKEALAEREARRTGPVPVQGRNGVEGKEGGKRRRLGRANAG